jgi:hypothetical protein
MDAKKLSETIIILGTAGLLLSMSWWAYFFNEVRTQLGNPNASLLDSEVLRCLISSSGPCGFVFGMANMAGAFAYTPLAFWISIILIVVGIALLISQKKS